MCGEFFHGHVHTELSPDGLGTTEALVNRAAELGFKHLAMTDHGTLGNAVNFWNLCNEAGIVPVLGLEAYLLWNGKRHHGTFLSLDETGWKNLVGMSNAAHLNVDGRGYPVLSVDTMQSVDRGGIVFLTGCPASPIHVGEDADALKWAGTMLDLFPETHVEVMCVMKDDHVSRPAWVARKLGLPLVLTNDVHYPLASQRNAHKILTECRKGFSYDSDLLWLKTTDEMRVTALRHFDAADVRDMMAASASIAERVTPWDMTSPPRLPVMAKALERPFFERLKIALERDKARRPSEEHVRQARYDMECDVIGRAGFWDYFIILDDVVRWARENGIVVGPGRGSGAGSYVLYLAGITGIDPIDHGLIFERFLNESRREYPDVDVDFESNRRGEVLEYARAKWGAHPIATYAHYGHKVAVQDVNRVLRLDYETAMAASEKGPGSAEFSRWASMHPDALPTYEAILGQARHAGKHAGGVVITDQVVPVENVGGNLVVAWTEGLQERQLSKVGVVKYDMLGLTALTQLGALRARVGRHGDMFPKPGDPVFNLFRSGDLLGIFQWAGSDGIRKMTMDIRPDSFEDLTVINALYRPGALDAGTAELYPSLAGGARKVHPKIDPVLAGTRGVVVFQEQMMEVFAVVMGIPFGASDDIRRLIVKAKPGDPKWERAVGDAHDEFMARGAANGFPKKVLVQLWGEIFTHSRYSFVRAHSASYTAIACELAWFKYHHPLDFYVVGLNHDQANTQAYLIEAALRGYELVTPHVNRPSFEYDGAGRRVFVPLNAVKFFGDEGAKLIVEERDRGGDYVDLEDFRRRIPRGKVNARACKHLHAVGAFDGLSGDPDTLFESADAVTVTEALGFALPTRGVAEHFNKYAGAPDTVVGYVHSWVDKKNKRGRPYRVYKLVPGGSFWIDDMENADAVAKGDFVRVVKNRYGKATQRYKIRG